MRLKERLKTWGPVALALLLTAAVFFTGALDRQKTWINMTDGLLRFPAGAARTAQDGGYGEMSEGPGLTLPPGQYQLKWVIDGDGENRVLLRTGNGAAMSADAFATSPGEIYGEGAFELYETAEDFEIVVRFEGGAAIDVLDFRLYSPFYRDHAFTFAIAALIFCAVWLRLRRGGWAAEDRVILLLVAAAVVYASVPSMRDNLIAVYDTPFHAARLCNLADGLRSGQFPVRVGGFSYNGYGAATSVFYPDVLLYPSALMLLAGASVQYVMNLYFAAMNALAAAAMYACARRIYGEKWPAACASILYTLALYRITDCYVRCALGEATAMSLLPMFLLGLWEVVLGDRRRWPLLAAGAACIYLSHMLTTLLCAAFAVAVCVVFIRRIVRERRLAALAKAALCTLLLCLFQLVPFLMYSAQGIGAQGLLHSVESSAIAPAQLFLWGEGDMAVDPSDTTINGQAIEPGLPLLLGVLLVLCLAVMRAGGVRRDRGLRAALAAAAGGCVAAFMTTTLFPWGYVRVLTGGLSDYLQFAWRLMVFVSLLWALAAGYGYAKLAPEQPMRMAAGVLALAVLFALPTLDRQTRSNDYLEYGQGMSSRLTYPEYQLPGTNLEETADREPLASPGLAVTAYDKDGTRVTAQVDAQEDAELTLPLFGFEGYRAEVDGERMEVGPGDNNRLTVRLPAGTSGTLRVWFAGRALWRICDAVSLAALLALLAGAIRARRRAARA